MPGTASVFAIKDGDYLLMEYRDDHPFEGQWTFPGGKIEEGESPIIAMLREAQEELGILPLYADPLDSVVNGTWLVYPWLITRYQGELPKQTDAGAPLGWLTLEQACNLPWRPSAEIARQIRAATTTAPGVADTADV